MKKIISLALAMILAFALAIPAFATEVTDNADIDGDGNVTWDPTSQNSTATVEYTMAGNYVVTIPSTIELGDNDGTKNVVAVSSAMLGYQQQLVIEAKSDGKLELLENGTPNQDVTIAYTIVTNTSKTVGVNATEILTIAPANEASGFSGFSAAAATSKVALTATVTGKAPYAGVYTDTVTFTTSVKPVQ